MLLGHAASLAPTDDLAHDEALAAIRDRLDRAQEHLEAIKGELLAYYGPDCCTLAGKFEPDEDGRGGEGTWEKGWIAPIQVRLNTLLGEFLHNARSALDHLARQLVERNGGEATLETRFPILRNAPPAYLEGQQPHPNVAGASDAAWAVIDEAQPYKWGDRYAAHPLWMLDKLWNIDKHRHVIARGVYLQARFAGDTPAFSYAAKFESADEYGAVFALVPDDPEVDVDAHATVLVSVEEPEFGIEVQLYGALQEILKTVIRVVAAAEDRCF